MPEERFPAEGVIGIASNNIVVYRSANNDGTDDIVVHVPEGLLCRGALIPVEGGSVLYFEGESADISGGIDFREGVTLQVGSVKDGVSGGAANQMVQILVPPWRRIQTLNWSPGTTNWS